MNERRVWIAQCLCPHRHAILAAAGEALDRDAATTVSLDPLRAKIAQLLRAGVINPWCGVCKAPAASWQYEVARTRFATLAEAEGSLRQSEAEQAVIRAAVGEP